MSPALVADPHTFHHRALDAVPSDSAARLALAKAVAREGRL